MASANPRRSLSRRIRASFDGQGKSDITGPKYASSFASQDPAVLRDAIDKAINNESFQNAIAGHLARLITPSIKEALDTIQPVVETVYQHDVLLRKVNASVEDLLMSFHPATQERSTELQISDRGSSSRDEIPIAVRADIILEEVKQLLTGQTTKNDTKFAELSRSLSQSTTKTSKEIAEIKTECSSLANSLLILRNIAEQSNTHTSALEARFNALEGGVASVKVAGDKSSADILKAVQASHTSHTKALDQIKARDAAFTSATIPVFEKSHADTASAFQILTANLKSLEQNIKAVSTSNSITFTELGEKVYAVVSAVGEINSKDMSSEILGGVNKSNSFHVAHNAALNSLRETLAAVQVEKSPAMDNSQILGLEQQIGKVIKSIDSQTSSLVEIKTGILEPRLESIRTMLESNHNHLINERKESDKSADILEAVQISNQHHCAHAATLAQIRDRDSGGEILNTLQASNDLHASHDAALGEIKASVNRANDSHMSHTTALESIRAASMEGRQKILESLQASHELQASNATNMSDIKSVVTTAGEFHASHAAALELIKTVNTDGAGTLGAATRTLEKQDTQIASIVTILNDQNAVQSEIRNAIHVSNASQEANTTSLSKAAEANGEVLAAIKESHSLLNTHHDTLALQQALLRDIKAENLHDDILAHVLDLKSSAEESKAQIDAHGAAVRNLHGETKNSNVEAIHVLKALTAGVHLNEKGIGQLKDHVKSPLSLTNGGTTASKQVEVPVQSDEPKNELSGKATAGMVTAAAAAAVTIGGIALASDESVKHVVDSAMEPSTTTAVESAMEPAADPISGLIVEPVMESVAEPDVGQFADPAIEQIAEPAVRSLTESNIEPVSARIVEPDFEPPAEIVEKSTEPVDEPAGKISEPVDEPAKTTDEHADESAATIDEPTEPVDEPDKIINEPAEKTDEPAEPVNEPTETIDEAALDTDTGNGIEPIIEPLVKHAASSEVEPFTEPAHEHTTMLMSQTIDELPSEPVIDNISIVAAAEPVVDNTFIAAATEPVIDNISIVAAAEPVIENISIPAAAEPAADEPIWATADEAAIDTFPSTITGEPVASKLLSEPTVESTMHMNAVSELPRGLDLPMDSEKTSQFSADKHDSPMETEPSMHINQHAEREPRPEVAEVESEAQMPIPFGTNPDAEKEVMPFSREMVADEAMVDNSGVAHLEGSGLAVKQGTEFPTMGASDLYDLYSEDPSADRPAVEQPVPGAPVVEASTETVLDEAVLGDLSDEKRIELSKDETDTEPILTEEMATEPVQDDAVDGDKGVEKQILETLISEHELAEMGAPDQEKYATLDPTMEAESAIDSTLVSPEAKHHPALAGPVVEPSADERSQLEGAHTEKAAVLELPVTELSLEEPLIEEQRVEEKLTEDPHVEETCVEEPFATKVEEPMAEEQSAEVIEEPTAEDCSPEVTEVSTAEEYSPEVIEEPTVKECFPEVIEEPVAEEQSVKEQHAEVAYTEEAPTEMPRELKVEELAVEKSKDEGVPIEEPHSEDMHSEEPSARQPPVDALPKEEAHVREIPEAEPPTEESPAKKPLIEEPIIEESKVEKKLVDGSHMKEVHVQELLVEEEPVEEPKVEALPAEEEPVEEQKVEELPIKKPKVQEPPAEEEPMEEPNLEEPSMKKSHVQEPPAEEEPVKEPNVKEPSMKTPHIQDPPTEEEHTKKQETKQPPSEEPHQKEKLPPNETPTQQAKAPKAKEPLTEKSTTETPPPTEPQAAHPPAQAPPAPHQPLETPPPKKKATKQNPPAGKPPAKQVRFEATPTDPGPGAEIPREEKPTEKPTEKPQSGEEPGAEQESASEVPVEEAKAEMAVGEALGERAGVGERHLDEMCGDEARVGEVRVGEA